MVNNPTRKDTNIPVKTSKLNFNSLIFSKVAPAIIGTDSKKVNLVAALLDKPTSLAVKMVVPLLENPGIIAKACDKPIRIACFNDIYLKSVSIL